MASSDENIRRLNFLETLGRGGFGSVYLAEFKSHQGIMQRVAVKVLHREVAETGDFAARQRDEARLLSQLNHDHIVKVFDLIEVQGRPAVVMEYIEGTDAETLARAGDVPARAAIQVVAAAAAALGAAWATENSATGRPLRVIHRDIKPANIIVSVGGGVKVLDFGVARAEMEREGNTRSVQLGTMTYIAPEQWLENLTSPAVDIFALGLTLIRLLTGRPLERLPLEGARFQAATRELSLAVKPAGADPEWLERLRSLLLDMLDRDPERRPSAEQVAERCQALADSAPGDSLVRFAAERVPSLVIERRKRFLGDAPPTAATDVTLSVPSSGSLPSSGPFSSAHERRRLAWILGVGAASGALALALLLAGGVATWIWLDRTLGAPPAGAVTGLEAAAPGAPPLQPTDLAAEPVAAPVEAPPVEAPPVEAPPTEAVASAAAPAEPAPDASAASSRAATSSARSAKKVAAPKAEAAAAEPARATFPVDIITRPFGATVAVDGKEVGTTPLMDLQISEGTHSLRVVSPDGVVGERRITVGERNPTRYSWTAESGTWTSEI